MKSLTTLIGIILVIAGIVALGYQGFSYTQEKKVAEIGNFQITAEQEKHVYLPPVVGGLSFVAVPRDRESEFSPLLIGKRQSRLAGLDDNILSLKRHSPKQLFRHALFIW
jgi:hypothetical protein